MCSITRHVFQVSPFIVILYKNCFPERFLHLRSEDVEADQHGHHRRHRRHFAAEVLGRSEAAIRS